MRKKLLSLLMSAAMILTLVPATAVTASAAEKNVNLPVQYGSADEVNVEDLNAGDVIEKETTLTTQKFISQEDSSYICLGEEMKDIHAFEKQGQKVKGTIEDDIDCSGADPFEENVQSIIDEYINGETAADKWVVYRNESYEDGSFFKLYLAPYNEYDKYSVWVEGTRVTEENKNDVLNDGGTVKFDPCTATLTLRNADIEAAGGNEAILSYLPELTIRLDKCSENKVSMTVENSEDLDTDMIYVPLGNLTVTGCGTLTMEITDKLTNSGENSVAEENDDYIGVFGVKNPDGTPACFGNFEAVMGAKLVFEKTVEQEVETACEGLQRSAFDNDIIEASGNIIMDFVSVTTDTAPGGIWTGGSFTAAKCPVIKISAFGKEEWSGEFDKYNAISAEADIFIDKCVKTELFSVCGEGIDSDGKLTFKDCGNISVISGTEDEGNQEAIVVEDAIEFICCDSVKVLSCDEEAIAGSDKVSFTGCGSIDIDAVGDEEGISAGIKVIFSACNQIDICADEQAIGSVGVSFSACNSIRLEAGEEGIESYGDVSFSACNSIRLEAENEGIESYEDVSFDMCRTIEIISEEEGILSDGEVSFNGCKSVDIDSQVNEYSGIYCGDCLIKDSCVEVNSEYDSGIICSNLIMENGNSELTATGKGYGIRALDSIRVDNGKAKFSGEKAAVAMNSDPETAMTLPKDTVLMCNEAYGTYDNMTEGSFVYDGSSTYYTAKTDEPETVYLSAMIDSAPACTYIAKLAQGKDMKLVLGDELAGTFEIKKNFKGYSLKNTDNEFVAFDAETGKIITTDKEYLWKYDGGLYVEVKSASNYNWFWNSLKKNVKKYYMTFDGDNLIVSEKKVAAGVQVSASNHIYMYLHDGDGKHEAVCVMCKVKQEPKEHSYDKYTHKCVCGKIDPEM